MVKQRPDLTHAIDCQPISQPYTGTLSRDTKELK